MLALTAFSTVGASIDTRPSIAEFDEITLYLARWDDNTIHVGE